MVERKDKMNTLVVLILLAAAAYVVYNAQTSTGWDWKKGIGALMAVIAAWWTWTSDWLGSLLQ